MHKLLIVFAMMVGDANAQCVSGVCPVGPPASGWHSVPAEKPHPAVCRITVRGRSGSSLGSGTLVVSDGAAGLVLTCSHLFDEGHGAIEVAFPSQPTMPATLIAIDRAEDLAVLTVGRLNVWPLQLADGLRPVGELTAAGYGGDGQYRSVTGPILGTATPQGARYPSLQIRGAVRPGDSGGPVLDGRGRLVAVVWGAREGSTYAAYGPPLRRIMQYAAEKLRANRATPGPVEKAPTPPTTVPTAPEAGAEPKPARPPIEDTMDDTLDKRLRSIEQQLKQQNRRDPPNLVPLLLTAVGVSGPIGLALSAAWLLLQRRRSGPTSTSPTRPIAIDTPPPPQHTTHETHYVPIERDAFARAHQWASEQVARKFPGAVDVLTTLDSLIKQQMNGGEK